MLGGSKRLHSGVRKAINRSANVRTIWRVFLQRKSYSTANICSGVGKGSEIREHKIKKDEDTGGKKEKKIIRYVWKENHKRTHKCV